MSAADEFWNLFRRMRAELTKLIPIVQTATVVSLTPDGEPVIQFDGDDSPSLKIYPRFSSYVPLIGDRVMITKGVIQGGWRHD